ncbi:MAG: hypothetical protein HN509_03860 [Halobacteriovoraceae bacterium]|jgi:hypothetical protein|nr:hypothetical protein [Halobacteriovoraceae bacterium]MBT5093008.1 hypothetical protein [Halobacteriovoraceae bacterium]
MKLLTILSLLSLSSCARYFTSPVKDYSDRYVTGKGLPADMDSAQLIKKLERKENMGGGVWNLTVFPYSKPLVEKLIQEQSQLKNLGATQKRQLDKKLREKYIVGKSCIHFEFELEKADKMAFLKQWKAYLVDNHDNEVALHWDKKSLVNYPAKSKSARYQGSTVRWTNSGDGCTSLPFVLKDSFRIKIVASSAPWPFERDQIFRYDFDKIVKLEGKKVNLRPKKKVQKYKGW